MNVKLGLLVTLLLGLFILLGALIAFFIKKKEKVVDFSLGLAFGVITMLVITDLLPEIIEESSITSEYIPKDENNYTVKCKIVEKNDILFEVSTFAGSRERAKQISDNWKNNASIIYPKIINLLLYTQR